LTEAGHCLRKQYHTVSLYHLSISFSRSSKVINLPSSRAALTSSS
jgi:hypothetical protein